MLNEEQVLQKLSEGWNLEDLGAGWHITEPNKQGESLPVSVIVVGDLEACDRIQVSCLGWPATATLIDTQNLRK